MSGIPVLRSVRRAHKNKARRVCTTRLVFLSQRYDQRRVARVSGLLWVGRVPWEHVQIFELVNKRTHVLRALFGSLHVFVSTAMAPLLLELLELLMDLPCSLTAFVAHLLEDLEDLVEPVNLFFIHFFSSAKISSHYNNL